MKTVETVSGDDIAAARAAVPRAFALTPRQRVGRAVLWAVFGGLVIYCLIDFGFTPQRILVGLTKLGAIIAAMLPPNTEPALILEAAAKIGETVAMAFLGTIIGGLIAFPLGFLGAKNIIRLEFLRLGVRRGFDVVRAFEQLVLALIFVRAFGLGPLAGILAIAVSDIGTLAKLYAEAIENTDDKPAQGVRAAGAARMQTIRFALVPQVLPVILSNLLYQFESNTRSATILGIVGAGGIGFMLNERMRGFFWEDVTMIVILLILAVYAIDGLSAWLRMKIIGRNEPVRRLVPAG